jgi:hypothetical protein
VANAYTKTKNGRKIMVEVTYTALREPKKKSAKTKFIKPLIKLFAGISLLVVAGFFFATVGGANFGMPFLFWGLGAISDSIADLSKDKYPKLSDACKKVSDVSYVLGLMYVLVLSLVVPPVIPVLKVALSASAQWTVNLLGAVGTTLAATGFFLFRLFTGDGRGLFRSSRVTAKSNSQKSGSSKPEEGPSIQPSAPSEKAMNQLEDGDNNKSKDLPKPSAPPVGKMDDKSKGNGEESTRTSEQGLFSRLFSRRRPAQKTDTDDAVNNVSPVVNKRGLK